MSTVNGTNGSLPEHTESSPLKQGIFTSSKLSILKCLWGWDDTPNASLRIVVGGLFGSAAIITLALFTQLHYGEYQLSKHGAVASDSPQCSKIAKDILVHGGNAIDAAISCTFCLGVVQFHITGLGGGGSSILYNHKQKKVLDVVDFEPSVLWFAGDVDPELQPSGPTVGIPGYLLGLWTLHKNYGSLPWNDLVMPSILLARNGFVIENSLLTAYKNSIIKNNSPLYELMSKFEVDQVVKFPKLANTLELIGIKGPSVFYNGSLADDIVYSVKLNGGSLMKSHLAQYETISRESMYTSFYGYNVIVPEKSFGSNILLNTLDDIVILDLEENEYGGASYIKKISLTLYDEFMKLMHKMNAFQHFQEPAASSVLVVDNQYNYISIVTGLNTWFGSQILTESGFILNSAVPNGGVNDDAHVASLSVPVVITPSKSMCGKRVVTGAGDARTIVQVLMELLSTNLNNTRFGVESPRFLIGNESRILQYEGHRSPQPQDNIVTELTNNDVILVERNPPYGSINAIAMVDDDIFAYADSRGGGLGLQF